MPVKNSWAGGDNAGMDEICMEGESRLIHQLGDKGDGSRSERQG